jgi:hypothetical protein
MTTYEFTIARKRHVALDDARALPGGRDIRCRSVLAKLQWRASMPNREVRAAKRPALTSLQAPLKRTVMHSIDQIQRALPHLNRRARDRAAELVILHPRCLDRDVLDFGCSSDADKRNQRDHTHEATNQRVHACRSYDAGEHVNPIWFQHRDAT